MGTMIQQGDVILESSDIPNDGIVVKPGERGFVLAEGEATGHYHAIQEIEGVEMLEKNGVFYIRILKDAASLNHEEHKSVVIPRGEYVVRKVREYDHFAEEARSVAD